MPGQTDNTDLLAGINQLIKAVNDLVLVSSCEPVTNVSNTVPTPHITVNCCGGGTGSEFDGGNVNATDTPPPGSEPDPQIDNRKCKAANFYYDGIREALFQLDIKDVKNMGQLGVAAALTITFAILGSAFPIVGTVIGAVVGAVLALVLAILIEGADPGDMLAVWDANHNEIVCAFYQSTSTDQARDNVIAICGAGGMSSAETGMLSIFMYNNGLKLLYQALPGSEAALDGYVSSVDCGACGGTVGENPIIWTFAEDAESWVYDPEMGLPEGNTSTGAWDNGALSMVFTKTVNNTSISGNWVKMYEPTEAGAGLVIPLVGATSGLLEVDLQPNPTCASSLVINMLFNDDQSTQASELIPDNDFRTFSFSFAVPPTFTHIVGISVGSHTGTNCPAPSTTQFLIQGVRLTFS